MDRLLLIFSWLFVIVMILMIVVPYWRRQADLVTTRNLFLLGSASFIGLSGVTAATSPVHYEQYSTGDYLSFFAGVITFYVTFWLTYRYFKWPRRAAGRRLRKWPSLQTTTLLVLLPLCGLMTLAFLSPAHVPGVAQLMVNIGKNGPALALVFVAVLWLRQPYNPALVYLLIGTFLVCLGLSMLGGTGRRQMVAVLAALPIVLYWMRYRYTKPSRALAVVAVSCVLLLPILNAYTNIRHQNRDRSVDVAIEMLKDIPRAAFDFEGTIGKLGQNAVEASLLSIHYHRRWAEPQPFHSMIFVLVNPIPRSLWPEKPVGFGTTLPHELYRLQRSRATWGPGIVGHGFHEGGLHMLVFYGFVVATALRFFDELLIRQPGNPYLLGILAAASGDVIGWPRGDIGTFTMQIIAAVAAGLALSWTARIFFGTGVEYPRSDGGDFSVTQSAPRYGFEA